MRRINGLVHETKAHLGGVTGGHTRIIRCCLWLHSRVCVCRLRRLLIRVCYVWHVTTDSEKLVDIVKE